MIDQRYSLISHYIYVKFIFNQMRIYNWFNSPQISPLSLFHSSIKYLLHSRATCDIIKVCSILPRFRNYNLKMFMLHDMPYKQTFEQICWLSLKKFAYHYSTLQSLRVIETKKKIIKNSKQKQWNCRYQILRVATEHMSNKLIIQPTNELYFNANKIRSYCVAN